MDSELTQIKEAQRALCKTTRRLRQCADACVPEAYLDVVRAAEQMFGLEQQLMERYAFPVRQLHLEQHARVLRGLHCLHAEVMGGASERGRRAGAAMLMDWLRLHNDTLDAAFKIWVDYCRNEQAGTEVTPGLTALTAH